MRSGWTLARQAKRGYFAGPFFKLALRAVMRVVARADEEVFLGIPVHVATQMAAAGAQNQRRIVREALDINIAFVTADFDRAGDGHAAVFLKIGIGREGEDKIASLDGGRVKF